MTTEPNTGAAPHQRPSGPGRAAPARPSSPHQPGRPPRRHFGGRGGGASDPPRRGRARVEHRREANPRPAGVPIPPPAEDTVRIIPLGGVEEIGRNMTALEYGGDIFIVDCGFQFREEETPGVDYILPNTAYLEERRDKIRGLLVTHGHLDHIGGLPYILDRIGNPTISTRKLTGMMIKKRQKDFSHLPEIRVREVE